MGQLPDMRSPQTGCCSLRLRLDKMPNVVTKHFSEIRHSPPPHAARSLPWLSMCVCVRPQKPVASGSRGSVEAQLPCWSFQNGPNLSTWSCGSALFLTSPIGFATLKCDKHCGGISSRCVTNRECVVAKCRWIWRRNLAVSRVHRQHKAPLGEDGESGLHSGWCSTWN